MKIKFKSIVMVITTIIIIVSINGPLYKAFDVQPGPVGGKYIALGQDIVGVHQTGGTLSPEAEEMVRKLTNVKDYNYSPYWANLSYDLDIEVTKFIKIYINTFIKNPKLMTRAILCRIDGAWNITTGRDAMITCIWYTTDKVGNAKFDTLYEGRKVNILTETIYNFGVHTTKGIGLDFFWRGGIHLAMILVCCVIAIIKKKYKICFVIIPIMAQILSLLLSTGWMDYRYFWSIFLVSYFLVIILLTQVSEENININV